LSFLLYNSNLPRYIDISTTQEVLMAKHKTAEQTEETAVDPAAAAPNEESQLGQIGDDLSGPLKRPFEPVRGWTSRLTGPLQYRKFTDANLKVIAFKFNLEADEKLPEEALAVMRDHKQDKEGKPTGLKFQDTRTHGKIWTIPNDVEGRALADKIDFRLSELAQKLEEGQAKTPF